MNKEFHKLCTPAKLYFIIAVISIIFALFNRFNIIALAINFLFALVWTLILSCLCDKGFSYLAWFLVLFPYFLILIAFLGLYRNIDAMTNPQPTTTPSNPPSVTQPSMTTPSKPSLNSMTPPPITMSQPPKM